MDIKEILKGLSDETLKNHAEFDPIRAGGLLDALVKEISDPAKEIPADALAPTSREFRVAVLWSYVTTFLEYMAHQRRASQSKN